MEVHMRTAVAALALAIFGGGCSEEEPVEPIQFNINMENTSAAGDLIPSVGDPTDILFAPGILILHTDDFALIEPGAPSLYPGFEAMVEDGSNADLIADLDGESGVISAESFAALDASYKDSPMLPGERATKSVDAVPGQRITVATMYGESNDVFVAALSIPLFDVDENALETDATADLTLWDAGTEINEEPGIGDSQAPRQSAPGSGEDEGGNVVEINGTDAAGFEYPDPSDMLSLRVTLGD